MIKKHTPWAENSYKNSLALYETLDKLQCLPNLSELWPLSSAINTSLKVITKTLRLYGFDRSLLAFNGGKDALVVFHLFRAAYAGLHRELSRQQPNLLCPEPSLVFFCGDNEFTDVIAFVTDLAKEMNCNLRIFKGSYIDHILSCLNEHGSLFHSAQVSNMIPTEEIYIYSPPSVAFLMGLRIGDPGSFSQSIYQPSSSWLGISASFMRVYPILYWTYKDIWKFLKVLRFKYCSLYDAGYTSVGSAANTKPNEGLRTPSGTFAPASTLMFSRQERIGRLTNAVRSLREVSSNLSVGFLNILGKNFSQSTALRDLSMKEFLQQLQIQKAHVSCIVLKDLLTPDCIAEIRAHISLIDFFLIIHWDLQRISLNITLNTLSQLLGLTQRFDSCASPSLGAIYQSVQDATWKTYLNAYNESPSKENFDLLFHDTLILPSGAIVHESKLTMLPILQIGCFFIIPGIKEHFVKTLEDVFSLYQEEIRKNQEILTKH